MNIKDRYKLSELIGVILGDGHIHKESNLITIVGSLEDLTYYNNRVIPLFQEIFNITPKLRRRKDRNSYYLMVYSKEIITFLTKDIGLSRGSKKNAQIPKMILDNNNHFNHFLRGIFDTDGYIKFSKQGTTQNYYPRIQIALQKSPLAEQIGILLTLLNFNYTCWKDHRLNEQIYYHISGKENTHKWFSLVAPQNRVHVSKYEFWLKYGYYIPKSSLQFRESSISSTKTSLTPQVSLKQQIQTHN